MSCKYCEAEKGKEVEIIANGEIEFSEFQYELYVSPNAPILVLVDDGDLCRFKAPIQINFCPMCGRRLKQRLTPAQENAYKGSPLRSSHKPIDGVVDTPKNAVQPVFHIGDKIRFKSTGTIEKVHYITGGGKFINSVSVEDVELIKES